jgi:site-specific DNA-cytosine methylase
MQSKDQISLFPLSLSRWEKYQNTKRNFRDGSPREIFFERGECKKINGIQLKTNRKQEGFPNNTDGSEWNKSNINSGWERKQRSSIRQLNNPIHSNNRVYSDKGISPTLNTAQGGGRQPFILRQRPEYINNKRELKNYEYNDVCPTISTNCGSGDQKNMVVIPVLTPNRLKKRQNGRRFKENGEPSFTLTAQDRHGIYNNRHIRRLTPIETTRLMGLKDDWLKYGIDKKNNKFEVSDSSRYKLCGNGVVINVVEEIMKELIK